MTALSMTRGDDISFDTAVIDDSGAVNLTSLGAFTMKWAAKRDRSESVELITKSVGSGIVAPTTPGGNIVRTSLVPSDTLSLPKFPTVLFWDLYITQGGKTYTLDSGTLTINVDVGS